MRLTKLQIEILEVLESNARGISNLSYITKQPADTMREQMIILTLHGMVEDAHRGAFRLTEKGADMLVPEPVLCAPTPSRSFVNSSQTGSYTGPAWNHRPCSNSAVLSRGWA